MTWARIDDAILDNPKVARVGPIGFALHVAAITYCARNLTDGFVPYGQARSLLAVQWTEDSDGDRGPRIQSLAMVSGMVGKDGQEVIDHVISLLLDAELWHSVPHGYEVHDYLDYNPTKEAVLAERAKKRAAGRTGGKRSADSRRDAYGTAQPRPSEARIEAIPEARIEAIPEARPEARASEVPEAGVEAGVEAETEARTRTRTRTQTPIPTPGSRSSSLAPLGDKAREGAVEDRPKGQVEEPPRGGPSEKAKHVLAGFLAAANMSTASADDIRLAEEWSGEYQKVTGPTMARWITDHAINQARTGKQPYRQLRLYGPYIAQQYSHAVDNGALSPDTPRAGRAAGMTRIDAALPSVAGGLDDPKDPDDE